MGVTKRTFDFPFRWEIEKLKKKKKKKKEKKKKKRKEEKESLRWRFSSLGQIVDFYIELFIQEITSRSFAEGS